MKGTERHVDVLVTGAAGSLGVQVTRELRRRALTVCAAGREPLSSDVVWDVTKGDGPQAAVRPHTIVHAAARRASFDEKKRDEAVWDVNVGGTAHVVEWALSNGVKRIIVISSAIVYGDWKVPRSESEEANPAAGGYYALSKWAAERLAQTACQSHCELVILRLSSLFGASFKTGLIRHFLAQAKLDGRIRIDAPVDDAFDLLHVTDAATTVVNAVESPKTGVWNVGGGEITSLTRIAEACASITGATIEQSRRRAKRECRILNWVDDTRARVDFGHRNTVTLARGVEEIALIQPDP